MKYIYAEIFKFEKLHNTRWENLCLTYEYYKYMSLFYLVKIYFCFKDYFYKTKEEKEEEKDAEKIFEFHH